MQEQEILLPLTTNMNYNWYTVVLVTGKWYILDNWKEQVEFNWLKGSVKLLDIINKHLLTHSMELFDYNEKRELSEFGEKPEKELSIKK